MAKYLYLEANAWMVADVVYTDEQLAMAAARKAGVPAVQMYRRILNPEWLPG